MVVRSALESLIRSTSPLRPFDLAHIRMGERGLSHLSCHRSRPPETGGCRETVVRSGAPLILSALLTLGACASTPTQPLKDSDRAAIGTIEVSPDVKVAPDVYYFGPNAMPGMLFGAVGGAIAAASNKKPADEA